MSLHSLAVTGSAMKFGRTLLVLLAASPFVARAQDFKCPPKDGQYEDAEQCDLYYVCKDGLATETLCPDGLVFDATRRTAFKCDQLSNVECGDRNLLQEPKGSGKCPRLNGFFGHPNPRICHIFYNCIDGKANENTCPAGLVFDVRTGVCTWPAAAGRTDCLREEKLDDGFVCPTEKQLTQDGNAVDHPRYPHPTDCQKFYICLNGVTPREHGCELGMVYNADSRQCDEPDNVAECADWYVDHPEVGGAREVGDRKVVKNKN